MSQGFSQKRRKYRARSFRNRRRSKSYREGKLSTRANRGECSIFNRFETDEFLKRTTFRLIIRSKIWNKTVKRSINFVPNDCRFRHFAA